MDHKEPESTCCSFLFAGRPNGRIPLPTTSPNSPERTVETKPNRLSLKEEMSKTRKKGFYMTNYVLIDTIKTVVPSESMQVKLGINFL